MAAYDGSRSYGSFGLAGRITATLASVVAAIAAWNDARVTRAALSRLTDRELEDIGLIRGDIDLVVEGRIRR